MNNMFQSVIPSIYPIIKDSLGLSFMQIGAFFGLSFGLGGIGSAPFGWITDLTSIQNAFQLRAFLPLLGIAAYFLPNIE